MVLPFSLFNYDRVQKGMCENLYFHPRCLHSLFRTQRIGYWWILILFTSRFAAKQSKSRANAMPCTTSDPTGQFLGHMWCEEQYGFRAGCPQNYFWTRSLLRALLDTCDSTEHISQCLRLPYWNPAKLTFITLNSIAAFYHLMLTIETGHDVCSHRLAWCSGFCWMMIKKISPCRGFASNPSKSSSSPLVTFLRHNPGRPPWHMDPPVGYGGCWGGESHNT